MTHCLEVVEQRNGQASDSARPYSRIVGAARSIAQHRARY
jgi:hypothetical protein